MAGRAVAVSEPALARATAVAMRLGIALEVEEAGNRVARVARAELGHTLTANGYETLEVTRYAMYYQHEPGRAARFLSVLRSFSWKSSEWGRDGESAAAEVDEGDQGCALCTVRRSLRVSFWYAASFGVRAVVNRCGVIAGPWQMGRVDQGVFAYWMLAHYFTRDLSYIDFGGLGKQGLDFLHVDDLVELIDDQPAPPDHWSGVVANVGGGLPVSLSLRETTFLCEKITGNRISVGCERATRPRDVPIYLSDCGLLSRHTNWRPQRAPRVILGEPFEWINSNAYAVQGALS